MYKEESNTAFTQKSRNELLGNLWVSLALTLLAACDGGKDPPPPPEPEAMVILKASANGYVIEDYDANWTGPLDTMLDFAESAKNRMNEIISDAGAVLLNADELGIVLDFKNNRFTLNGERYSDSVEDADEDDLVHFIIKDQSSKWKMQGGSLWVKRALLNSRMPDLEGLLRDIEAGVDYSLYQADFKTFDDLIGGAIALEDADVTEDEFQRVQKALDYMATYPHLLMHHAREEFNLIAISAEEQGVDIAAHKLTGLVYWMEDGTLVLAIRSPGAVNHKTDNLGVLKIKDWFSFEDTSYLELSDGTRIHLGALFRRLFLSETPREIEEGMAAIAGNNHTLIGTDYDDILVASATHYDIDAGGGSDLLIGNDLANHLKGGGGDDRLEGHAGNDTLEGGEGDDVLVGGDGVDVLNGGAGTNDLQS